jgi:hypothetical protein
MNQRERNTSILSQLKKWEKPRNNFFQSSITTLPGPSISIRNEQIKYTPEIAQNIERSRNRSAGIGYYSPRAEAPNFDPSKTSVDNSDAVSTTSKTTTRTGKSSVTSSSKSSKLSSKQSTFKNQIPNLYDGKFSPENIPDLSPQHFDFSKK